MDDLGTLIFLRNVFVCLFFYALGFQASEYCRKIDRQEKGLKNDVYLKG